MSQYLKIFITVSVLLNLLLAGIIVGDIGRYFMGQKAPITLHELVTVLPVDKRDHFKDTIAHDDQDITTLRQQLSNARKKAVDILKTEPFNKDAYLAQIQMIRQLKDQIRQRMTEAVTALAAQATPKERAAMADMLFQ